MNRQEKTSTPLSCYRADRSVSPTLPCRFLCAPTSAQSSLEAGPYRDYRTDDNLVERFELLPDDSLDDDSIFSNSSAEDLASNTASDEGHRTNHIGVQSSLPPRLLMPSLQPRTEYNLFSASYSEHDVRRKMKEAALFEAMSSPGRSLRQSQAVAIACGRSFDQAREQVDIRNIEGRRGISQPPRRKKDLDYDPTFGQRSASLQPGYRNVGAPAFTQVGVQSPHDEPVSFKRSWSDQAQMYETFTGKPAVPHIDLSPRTFQSACTEPSSKTSQLPCSILSPKSCQSSDFETTPSHDSTLSVDSEVKYYTSSRARTSSCHGTACTAETSDVDLSSKDSSDLSDKSNEEVNKAGDEECTATDESPTPAIENSVAAYEVTTISNREYGGANSPRSALLEKCGWSHRYARHRGINSSNVAAQQPLAVVPLLNKGHTHDEMALNDKKRTLLSEIDDLKREKAYVLEQLAKFDELEKWKVEVLEDLDAKTQEVETLKQCAAKHASEAEMLKSESVKNEENRYEEVSMLKSQMTAVANQFAELQRINDVRSAEIRELEQVAERTKSVLLARDAALSAKNQEIIEKNSEIEELKLELTSMIAAKADLTQEADEDLVNERDKEILALSNKNEELNERIKEMEAEIASSSDKCNEAHRNIENLNACLDLKQAEVTKLLGEIAESREENSSLRDEIDAANRTILQSTNEILSLRSDLDGLRASAAEILGYKDTLKILQAENASLIVKLECKTTSCKDLSSQIIALQDQLKAAGSRIDEARDEASALRVNLGSTEAIKQSLSAQISSYKEKLKASNELLAEVREDNDSIAAAVNSKSAEIVHLRKQLLTQACGKSKTESEPGTEINDLISWKQVAEASMEANGEEMEALCKQNQELRLERGTWITRCESKTSECEQLLSENMNHREELAALKVSLAEVVDNSSSLRVALESKSAECERLHEQLVKEKAEYNTSISQLKANTLAESVMHAATISKLESDVVSKTSEVTLLAGMVEKQSLDMVKLQDEIDLAEKDLVGAINEIEEMERLLAESGPDECERLASEVKLFEEKLKAADEDYISLRLRFESYEELSKELAVSKNECIGLKAKVTELEQQLSNEELAVINFEVSNLKKTNTALSSKMKDLELDLTLCRDEVKMKSEKVLKTLEELTDVKVNCQELELAVKAKTEEISHLHGALSTMRENVKLMRDETEERIMSLTSSNNSKTEEILQLQSEIASSTSKIRSLEAYIDECKAALTAERGPRLKALRELEQSLQRKEKQIFQHQIETKNASTEVEQAKAKVMATNLLNESLSAERDELRQWKHSAEEQIQKQSMIIDDLTSRASSLLNHCSEHELSNQEKEGHIRELEHAVARFEVDMLATSKKIVSLKDQVESKSKELDSLRSEIFELNNEVSELKMWKENTRATIKSNSKKIKALSSDKLNLESQVQELSSKEQSLTSQLLIVKEEKIALAKSSLSMASAYEEKMKDLEAAADRVNALEIELEQTRCKYEHTQNAVKSLEEALTAVEKQRRKLIRQAATAVHPEC